MDCHGEPFVRATEIRPGTGVDSGAVSDRRQPLLRLSPWRRAPLLLARSPGVLAAMAGAGFLLTLAVASRPVFLGSAGAAAVASDIKDGCRYEIGLRVTAGRILRVAEADQANLARLPERTRLLAQASAGDGVQPVVTTVAAGNVEVLSPQGERGQGVVQLFSRTGSFDHVNVRARAVDVAAEDGLWVPDTTAALLHVGAGDSVRVAMGDKVLPARVAAVFDDLTYLERPKFWCGMQRSFEPLGSNPLPPVALASEGLVSRMLNEAGRVPPQIVWEVPPADGMSVPRAEAVSHRLAAIDRDLRQVGPFGERFGVDDGVLLHLGLPATVAHAHLVERQVRTTADTVGAASTAIALVAVAAAGFFWVDRRRGEVSLLLAKGVGPVGLAVKAALESAAPLAAGAAGGVAAAVALVRWFGPSSASDGPAVAAAVRLSALAVAAGLALLALAAGVRAARAEQRMAGVPHHRRGLVPAALACLAGAAVASAVAIEHSTGYTQLGAGRRGAGSLGLIVVVFPLLVLVGGGGLIAVVGHWLLPRTRRMGAHWPTAPYLAVRRAATAGPMALALTAGSVVSVGILLYASVVAASARATVVSKAGIGVGSDMAVFLPSEDVPELPSALAGRTTPVLRTAADLEDDEGQVDVLGLDRRSFGRAALYDSSFGGRSLSSLLDRLDGRAPTAAGGSGSATTVAAGSVVPVIAADANHVPDRFTLDFGGTPVAVRVVARVRAFPGMSGEQPLVVAEESALRAHGIRGNRQLWVKGSTKSVLALLDRAHIGVVTTTEAKSNQAASSLLPLATSLGYFKALGLLGGTVTLCGAVFYLASRQRARRLAAVMARGMGLTRMAARAALALELGALLLAGLALGGGLSSWAARVTFPHLDPSPGTPPPLIFRWDPAALAWTAVVTLAATALLSLLSERASARTPAAEVVRDA